ncbi:N-acetylgalactosamine kinase-like [Babylonia areolata]|uniref:N-acetylgalactosamine kinase-like n=1 Tax=Babylonia areolata TaxID=304850 RepID=UPI003FD3C57D
MTCKMADADNPPRVQSVPEKCRERYADLRKKFKDRFGQNPVFYARSPGRVNLIGEHIDYSGYAVLPMAIEQDIVFAVAPTTDGSIVLANIKPDYKEFSCTVNDITISKTDPKWHNYILCGIKGTMEHMGADTALGFNAVVDGSIPRSAGLSSSSALVCCAAITMNHVNDWKLSLKQLAELTASCERYIGTEGGGMDQAISLMASSGMAKLIKFDPLETENVQLPPDASFLISNSLAEHNKAASSEFNTRVVECRLAAQVLAKLKGLPWREVRRLRDIQEKLGMELEDMVELVKNTLKTSEYTKDEVLQILEVTSDDLASTSLSQNTLGVTSFQLYKRAVHVFAEASRVFQFKKLCDTRPPDVLTKLGALIDASQQSLKDLYECTHPETDMLVEVCKSSGVVGCRMVGAGWGGCVVSLVNNEKTGPLFSAIRDKYFTPNPAKAPHVAEAHFATQPGPGAMIYVD